MAKVRAGTNNTPPVGCKEGFEMDLTFNRGDSAPPRARSDMASVELDKINKLYENGFHAVKDLSIDVADGEFLVLVGPSGCGKSTALRMVAGLEDISSGELRIGGKRVNEVEPQDRDIAMVFQSYALYPHMSVRTTSPTASSCARCPRTR